MFKRVPTSISNQQPHLFIAGDGWEVTLDFYRLLQGIVIKVIVGVNSLKVIHHQKHSPIRPGNQIELFSLINIKAAECLFGDCVHLKLAFFRHKESCLT